MVSDDALSADSDDESLSSSSGGSSSSTSSSGSSSEDEDEEEEGERLDSEGLDTMDETTLDGTPTDRHKDADGRCVFWNNTSGVIQPVVIGLSHNKLLVNRPFPAP